MHRPAAVLVALAALGAALLTSAAAAQDDVTGEDVRRAIRRGVQAILTQQRASGDWPEPYLTGGVTSLATLTLLQSGEKADSDALVAALDQVQRLPNQHTYVVSLKILALAQADPVRYADQIQEAARWLVSAQTPGGLWNYTEVGNRFDHSNAQFALLGLHAAALVGVEVPFRTWQKAQSALLRNQNPDGGWSYQTENRSYGSMTAAGVANLLILTQVFPPLREKGFRGGGAPDCGRARTNRPLERGFQWLERHFQAGSNPRLGEYTYYWLYAVERCGIISGRRFLGRHDWYRAGAGVLVRTQSENGLWNSSVADTCFAVLFLAKGHRSLVLQKLQWSQDDAWNPDPHDAANLIDYIDMQLGQPVAWQVVPFDEPMEEWLAAPLLYFHGHEFPEWNEAQRAKLRAFIAEGGTIFAEACCGSEDFRRGFEQFAAATFPESPLRELGPQHAVYRVLHTVEPYGLRGIDIGCRTAVLYSPNDVSCLWEQKDVPVLSEQAFRLGTNIAAYAVGRRPLRDRLDAVVLPKAETQPAESQTPALDALRLAQVVYNGDWRPFPTALSQLAESMRLQLGFDVVAQERQIRLTDDALRLSPILYMAGTFGFELSPAEREALAAHLRRGGFLIADANCGTEPFNTAFRRALAEMFPDATLEPLPADHPLFNMRVGFDVRRVSYTPDVQRARPDLATPELLGLRVEGRLAVVFSPYALGCGLAGGTFDGCWGYERESARKLAANLVLYALTH